MPAHRDRHRPDWLRTATNEPRGYVQPQALRDVWFHTGTVCNLRCPFCLEGSKPGDNRLNPMTLNDARPFLDEALDLGVEQFSFTGGEPFVVPEFLAILGEALERRPCLVLTNGTEPLLNRLDEVFALRAKPQPLRFRISLDYPDAARHDAGRGAGAFARSLDMLGRLQRHGFRVSIARQGAKDEDAGAIEASFRAHFRAASVPEDTPIVWFPDFLTPGSLPEVPAVTEDCMTRYHTAESRAAFMCSFSKMIVKKNGRMRVYACTLVDDDDDYDLGGTLSEAQPQRIMLKHHRCYSCFATGCSCSEK